MKRNRFDIAPQALLLASGVILSIILISIMIAQFDKAKSLSEVVSGQIMEATQRLKNSEIDRYDGIVMTGAEVRNFYKMYLTESAEKKFDYLKIDNGIKEYTYDSYKSYSGLVDRDADSYINPGDLFSCVVNINANGVVTDVHFIKQLD